MSFIVTFRGDNQSLYMTLKHLFMKKQFLLILFVSLFAYSTTLAQRLRDKDVIGEWELVIDIDEDRIEEEIEEEGSNFATSFASAIAGFAIDIVEDLDIVMVFHKDHTLDIVVEMWGSEEIEEGEWYINDDGALVIIEDDDYDGKDHDVWVKDGKNLVQLEKNRDYDDEANVYLKRLD